MNIEGEINKDNKMVKMLNFFIFTCFVQENQKKIVKNKDLRVIIKQQPSQNGYKKQVTR